MAGLERFEPTEEWRNEFKKHLFMERNTVLKASNNTVKETKRYSMDISSDLQNILKERNVPRACQTPNKKENRNPSSTICQKFDKNVADNTFMESNENFQKKQDVSDESFEAMEQMCDKTASDPNSTLFQYLNSNNKREIIEATKQRRSAEIPKKENDKEIEALHKLMNEFHGENQQQIENESMLRGVELTQIEDIEAPSRFWDSTVMQTSPVKMVGLLRPSTIMEEGADDSNTSSAQTSYKSAAKTLPEEISSTCYETASEAASFFNFVTTSGKDIDPLNVETLENDPLHIRDEEFEHANVSSNLIDFEKTLAANNLNFNNCETPSTASEKQQRTTEVTETTLAGADEQLTVNENEASKSESDESIIELLSDEETDLSPFENKKISNENIETTPSIEKSLIKWETPLHIKRENISSSLRRSSIASNASNDGAESQRGPNSPHFNDTLEEVEYLMKKGMEMIQAKNDANESLAEAKNEQTPELSKIRQKAYTVSSPSKGKDQLKSPFADVQTPEHFKIRQNTYTVSSPSKGKDQLKSPFTDVHAYRHRTLQRNTPIANHTPKNAGRFAINMKPVPKFDIFKVPTSNSKPGNLAVRHKDQFPHIVSPIGTYVNKTAKAPLMTTIKNKPDCHNSTAFLELERESRLYKPNFNHHENIKLHQSPNARTLPKKAYISSEFRQITDERSPVTIPGGKKIQKYLDAAVMPAVIRHDGKAKMPGLTSKIPVNLQKGGENNSKIPQPQEPKDMSLANLSIMSGDVSVYTIKDAQKL